MTRKTREELEALKDNWLKDPCWDIEDTEGYEDHIEELLDFRLSQELLADAELRLKEDQRREKVMISTGVGTADVKTLDALFTWEEIEHEVSNQDRYIGSFSSVSEQVMAELMQAQVRATLLQAAQLKRIADALENIDDGDSLARTVEIWGSGK